MKVNDLCKRLALQEVFETMAVDPGGALSYRELQRCWDETGMRRSDLDDALTQAVGVGDVISAYGDNGQMVILTQQGHERAEVNPDSLQEIEALRQAMVLLEWMRLRMRQGPRSGRRADDRPLLH